MALLQGEALRKIDDEILVQLIVLARLRVRRNALMPIYRLPPEIISLIFLSCMPTKDDIHSSPSRHAWIYSWWKAISHVCHHWRDVALSTPALWSVIDFRCITGTDMMETFLARSRHAPLDIDIDNYSIFSWDPDSLCDIISSHMHHVGRLRILPKQGMFADSDIDVSVPPANGGSVSAPVLRTLFMFPPFPTEKPLPLPRFLARVDAPSLNRLSLQNYQVDWTWRGMLPSSLRSLHIGQVGAQPQAETSPLTDILSVLRDLIHLEELSLDHVFPRELNPNRCFEHLPPVVFPRLKLLSLSDDPLLCMHFLRLCRHPAETRFQIFCDRMIQPANVAFVASALSDKLLSGVAEEDNENAIHYLIIHSQRFQVQKKLGEFPYSPSETTVDLDFLLPFAFHNPEKEATSILIYSICARLPLQKLSVLSFFDLHGVDWICFERVTALGQAWHEFLAAACHAETLEFSAYSAPGEEGFLELLYTYEDGTRNPSFRDQVQLPHVKRLAFSYVNFDGFVETVEEAIRVRETLVAPDAGIEEVTLLGCRNMGIEDVESLQDLPVRVLWDSQEYWDTDPDSDSVDTS